MLLTNHMKAILLMWTVLCISEARGEGVEIFVSRSASLKDRVGALKSNATSFYLVFKNNTKQIYYVLKPVNITGFSCYHLKIKNSSGGTRLLYPQMISSETTGSAPEPLAIKPGEISAVEMFLYPQQDARHWNYSHTWNFKGFQDAETELIVSYSHPKEDLARFNWLSRYSLKGQVELNICAKVAIAGSRQNKTRKAEQGGAGQPATVPESKPQGKEKPKPESEGRSQ